MLAFKWFEVTGLTASAHFGHVLRLSERVHPTTQGHDIAACGLPILSHFSVRIEMGSGHSRWAWQNVEPVSFFAAPRIVKDISPACSIASNSVNPALSMRQKPRMSSNIPMPPYEIQMLKISFDNERNPI